MTGRSIGEGLELACAVAGGPVAWLAQVNLTYPLIAIPCFPGAARNLAFPGEARWAFILAIAVYLVLLCLAIASALLARKIYRRIPAAKSSADHFEGAGAARIRFLAFCGTLLGTGFSGAILINGLSLLMVPPCAI
jgi:hypothetical protein